MRIKILLLKFRVHGSVSSLLGNLKAAEWLIKVTKGVEELCYDPEASHEFLKKFKRKGTSIGAKAQRKMQNASLYFCL